MESIFQASFSLVSFLNLLAEARTAYKSLVTGVENSSDE